MGGYAIAKKKTWRRNLSERRIVHKKARVKKYPRKLYVLVGFVTLFCLSVLQAKLTHRDKHSLIY